MSLRDVSDRCGVAGITVARWVRDGQLPIIKLGSRTLVDPADLNAFIAARRTRNVPKNGDDPVPTGPSAKETADASGDSFSD